MRFGVWTSGTAPVPAVIAAMKEAGLELGHILVCDDAQIEPIRLHHKDTQVFDEQTRLPNLLLAHPVDCVVLLSFPHILPAELVQQQLFLNCHNALLPRHRGMHAFTWAIIQGDTKVGYTLHHVEGAIDAGPILAQCSIDVEPDDTINEVFLKGGQLLPLWIPEVLKAYRSGRLSFLPQDEAHATRGRRRTPVDGLIDWNQPARSAHNFIRAQAPPYAPGAFTRCASGEVILALSECEPMTSSGTCPGTIVGSLAEGGFLVQCSDHPIHIKKAWSPNDQGHQLPFHGAPGLIFL